MSSLARPCLLTSATNSTKANLSPTQSIGELSYHFYFEITSVIKNANQVIGVIPKDNQNYRPKYSFCRNV